MGNINNVKEQLAADTPLLLFDCLLPSGDVERWCTHAVSFNGNQYRAQVLEHNMFELQLSADEAMDGISQLTLRLANADSRLSEINSVIGFKGSQLLVSFAFADLSSLKVSTESTILFRGVAGDPDEVTENSLTLSFLNKLSLQRIPVPEIRIQRTCPWHFPVDSEQRSEARDGGNRGRFSRFYRCGYSAGVLDGIGNLSEGQPFASCDKSRSQCIERGMFDRDLAGNVTRRFGGMEFVPSLINVRTTGDKTSHVSPLLSNSAKYNDPVPLVYGTGWLKTPVIFARNDGNLTHMEVVVGAGTTERILKVVVNDIEIPSSSANQDLTTTGWYSVLTSGARTGSFNLDFTDSDGKPLGDPYGSISALVVVVPNRIASGTTLPTVEVLVRGMELDTYTSDGSFNSTVYSNNPAWVILDLLRRCGWSTGDLNLSTFYSAAQHCGALIQTIDANDTAMQVARYACNLILTKRQSAASIIRGIRVASSLMLRYGASGLLELLPEATIAAQQPTLPEGSNSVAPINGGWPAYEFSDGSAPFSGIVRYADGSSSVRLSSRSIVEISNRLSVEFQDEANEFQQDSLSIVDSEDLALVGYEISSQSTALGIANYNQATRVLLRQLDKLTKGNLLVEFQTSFRALRIRPGDIIALTYLKEGFNRLPLRVTKLSPSTNYATVTILAQIHNDDWYSDNPAVLAAAGRQPSAQLQTPRPLIGLVAHKNSNGELQYFDFSVQENIQALQDGTATDTIAIGFSQPTKPSANATSLPLLSLSPTITSTGGALAGGTTYYYALSASNAASEEGTLSFTVAAAIPEGTNSNAVILSELSFPRGAESFNVYRGTSPQTMYRIDSKVPLANRYLDIGLPAQAGGPPDPNFDHANFYYRYEYAGPFNATIISSNTIGSPDMGATALAYVGMVARIVEGKGLGQERSIASNDSTTLHLSSTWSTLPDSTSQFVVCEPSWQFGAVSALSPVKFEIAYRSGSVIQISGRAANILNQEGSPELCPLTRLALGERKPDVGVPSIPEFVLDTPGAGELTLTKVGFSDDKNVGSISSGTLQLYFWNEIQTPSNCILRSTVDGTASTVQLNQLPATAPSSMIQIGSELMNVLSVDPNTKSYTVARSAFGSSPVQHLAGEQVLHLDTAVMVVPFATNFFTNRASVNYLHSFALPDVRIGAAEFHVSNSFGDGQTGQRAFSGLPDGGLRTLSGGQFSIQTSGAVVSRQNAAPPLVMEADHAVRDIRATLGQAFSGYDIQVQVLQQGKEYCRLDIASGATNSAIVSGAGLPPLGKLSLVTINVALQPLDNFQGAINLGKDLAVTVRL